MSFKDFERIRCWMGLRGEIHDIPKLSNHHIEAIKILRNDIEPRLEFMATDILMKKGWMRVNNYLKTLIVENEENIRPNPMQMKSSEDLAIERDLDIIEFYNGVQKTILWDKDRDRE